MREIAAVVESWSHNVDPRRIGGYAAGLIHHLCHALLDHENVLNKYDVQHSVPKIHRHLDWQEITVFRPILP